MNKRYSVVKRHGFSRIYDAEAETYLYPSMQSICDTLNGLTSIGREELSTPAATPQPTPHIGQAFVGEIVLQDIQLRIAAGECKYSIPLMTHNGRDALWDAYQEAIDLTMYLRQAILERPDKGETHEEASER